MNCEYTSNTTIKKTSFDMNSEHRINEENIIDNKDVDVYTQNNDNIYYNIINFKEPNTEDAFSDNIHFFNFEDYFTV